MSLSKKEFHELIRQRASSRWIAAEYYADLKQHVGEHLWEKHYARDVEEHPWLDSKFLRILEPYEEF